MPSRIDTIIANSGVTAEAIAKARDTDGLSWRDVAKTVGLSNPSAARKVYSVLLGKDSKDSSPVAKRAPNGSSSSRRMAKPNWDNGTDTEEITNTIQGGRIWVSRLYWQEPECIRVGTVLYYDTETVSGKPVDLTVTFIESGNGNGTRSVFVHRIESVR